MRLKGTIIDLETTGEFDRTYPPWDPRQYTDITPTILGYITDNTLVQHCAEGIEEIPRLLTTLNQTLPTLMHPFYALNTRFEKCIIQNTCGLLPPFMDVRGNLKGSKWEIRHRLNIPTYDDPFNGEGYRCPQEWHRGNYHDCMRHNRACLLIERDIQEHTHRINTQKSNQ